MSDIIDLTQDIWTFSREARFSFVFIFLQFLGRRIREKGKERGKDRKGRGREREERGEKKMKKTMLCL